MSEKKLILDIQKYGSEFDITFSLDSFDYIIDMGIEQNIEFFEKLQTSIKQLKHEIEKDEAKEQYN